MTDLTVEGFRFRADDGGLGAAGASWLAAQNADYEVVRPSGSNIPIRFRLGIANNSGGGGGVRQINPGTLQVRLNGGAWTDADAVAYLDVVLTSHYADGANPTNRLGALGSGSYDSANSGAVENSAVFDDDDSNINANNWVETEFALELVAGQLSAGDKIEFAIFSANEAAILTDNVGPAAIDLIAPEPGAAGIMVAGL